MNSKNNITGNISFNDSSKNNKIQLTNKQNKENNINKPTYNIKYTLNEKEKKRKERIEEAPRYGLRKLLEDGDGNKLLVGSTLVRLDTVIKINGEKYFRFLNIHDQNGRYLSDHIHVKKEDVKGRISTFVNPKNIDPLVYLYFSGQPYNYNENRLDGLSINVSYDTGGSIFLPPQKIIICNDYRIIKDIDISEKELSYLNKILLDYTCEELLIIIEFIRQKINCITKTYLSKDFIYNYIIYNYFMEISHKNLYYDNISLNNVDFNILIHITVLLLNTIYELQSHNDIEIPKLFKHIGYILTSIQDIHNFESPNAKGNGDYILKFEPLINKTNTWQSVEYRKQNLNLDWRQIPDKNTVYTQAFKGLNYYLDDITFQVYAYSNK